MLRKQTAVLHGSVDMHTPVCTQGNRRTQPAGAAELRKHLLAPTAKPAVSLFNTGTPGG